MWGVRSPVLVDDLRGRCALFALRLPAAAFFSHATAALLHGMPLPLALEREPLLHVGVAAPARAPHATGIAGHSLEIRGGDLVTVHGLRMTSAERTWLDLATMLPLIPLVAAGDYAVHHRLPFTTIGVLAERVAGAGAVRGITLLREAVALLNNRAESPPESELRVILSLAGMPTPRINHVLVDTETGRELRTDFAFREQRVVLEYQGDYHRTRAQWRKDMTRRSRLEAQGWYVMELNADDLRDPGELVARIRTVFERQSR